MSEEKELKCSLCGYFILADTEDWEKPLCYQCYVKMGYESQGGRDETE